MLKIIEMLLTSLWDLCVELISIVFITIKNRRSHIIDHPSKNFSARLAKAKRVLSRKGKGFCLSGIRSLSLQDSHRNALIIGGTGTGKSTVCLVPSILKMATGPSSLIIHDPSGELLGTTSQYLESKGYKVLVLRYDQAKASVGYNPLVRIRRDHDIDMIAHTLIHSGLGNQKGGDPFWEKQAEYLLHFLVRLTLYQSPTSRTLATVLSYLDYLQGRPQVLKELVLRTGNPELKRELESFLASQDKILGGAIATIQSALKHFGSGQVKEITSHDTISIESLRKHKTALFIQNPIMTQKAFAPLTSLFFTQLFEYLLNDIPGPNALNVFLLIDEASSFKIDWPLYLANVRKYRTGVLLALQSFDVLQEQYSIYEAQSIAANTFAKLYFTNQPFPMADQLSKSIGDYSVESEKGREERYPLMAAQEIMMMPKDRALLFAGNHPPMLAKLKPYYQSKLRKWIKRSRKITTKAI